MGTSAQVGCYDICYRGIRPNVRRAVTAPDTLANTGEMETAPATVARPKYIPTALLTSPIDPPPHERTLLKEQDLKATHSVLPLPRSLTTPLGWHPQAEPCLSAGTAIEILVLQSDPSPATMVTISRGEFATLQCLSKYLERHSLFHTYADQNPVTVLCINNLPPFEYLELYNLLAPQLDDFRIKIDFYDTTLIMRRPSHTHESGVAGWNSVGSLLQNKMPIPPAVKSYISWQKGQIDVNLPPLSPGDLRIKCPDASLGRRDRGIPTLVLETGYSQTPGKVHIVAKSWLWRLVRNEIEALEDHAVQCVIRNETDTTTGALKREPTVRNHPTCTIPACISKHNITTKQIFNTWIWDYLSEVRQGTDGTFDILREHPRIPRSTHIPQNRRETVWVNVPIKVWVWSYFNTPKEWDLTDGRETLWLVLRISGQTGTTGIEDGGFYDNSGTIRIRYPISFIYFFINYLYLSDILPHKG
ncbi:hypothetical protein BGX38DRAFT_1232919 [Terfezia claveryi]|nr:hypothetical protein BGX38DRAFT_1232919 [Terfezia claveryi]